MNCSEYSVVIVGSGAAGLYAALKISQQINLPNKILLISKSTLGESNSMYAQGGIVGVVHQNPDDNVQMHIIDTLKAGAGLSEEIVTKEISEASDVVINDLIKNGVKFDCDKDGNITFTLEAAHSIKRILHSGGDATGKGITEGLAKAVRKDKNIRIMENTVAVEVLTSSDKECKGLIIYNSQTNKHEIIYSSAVILATGGVGQVYKYTTNPNGATGDGVAIAYEAGADMQDMEFIQFHPTALAISPESQNRFLISEAVRGEGAKLINNKGEQFMSKYSDKLELAPRDVVTRAIFKEMSLENKPNMYLDATIIGSDKITKRFPTITARCKENGIDITKEPIPVAPAAHYTMGGIKADISGKTSIKNLYAIGEAACTGFHGANRLASNSLLECVVCAYKTAEYLSSINMNNTEKYDDENVKNIIDEYSKSISEDKYNVNDLKSKLKEIMWNNVGIIRTEESLLKGEKEVSDLKKDFKRKRKCLSLEEYEYRNMLTVASLVIQSALNRKESRGAHCRSDYPQTQQKASHSVINIH